MGAIQATTGAKARKARKATFTTEVVDGKRQFTPVNKRAKAFTTVLGQKTLQVKDLKNIKKAGFRTYEYIGGKLKAITL